MGDRDKHRALYKQIPTFKCRTGCTDCCGPVPVTEWEAERLGIAGKTLTPTKPGTLACLFSTEDGCSVYDKRPYMCRAFGAVDEPRLACPHGCKPKRLLSKTKVDELYRDTQRQAN